MAHPLAVKTVEARFPKIYAPLDQSARYKMLYGGRGSAKSWTVARKLLLRGAERPTRVLCTRELQKTIKQSVHRLLRSQIHALGLEGLYTVTDSEIRTRAGTEFIFMGVRHNVEEIKSTEGIDICWIEEGQNLTEESWNIIDPTIRAEGSEIWCVWNTGLATDFLHRTFVVNEPPPGSLVIKANYYDNPYLPGPLKTQAARMREEDYENYAHIWLGEVKEIADGAVFKRQIENMKRDNRLTVVPVLSNSEVNCYFDLGRNDHTAIWMVQRSGPEVRIIDYYENRLEDVDHYVKHLKSLGYNYGTFYLPHDADHQRMGMTRTIRQQFEDGGIKPCMTVDRIPIKQHAIALAREMFPKVWIHQGEDERGERVKRGWECLCGYRYAYDENRRTHLNNPVHDWASNGADAFMAIAQADQIETLGAYAGAEYDWNESINV